MKLTPKHGRGLALTLTALVTLSSPATAATLVYQDSFDNDGAANSGTGGSLNTGWRNSGTEFTDNGDLSASTNGGGQQSWAWTQSEFDLSGGFEMVVTFTTVAAGNPSFTFSFGLLDEVSAATTGNGGLVGETGNFRNVIAGDTTSGIAFGTTTRNGGIAGFDVFTDTSFTEINDDITTSISLGTTQTLTLTVNADGSGSASLGTGTATYAAGTFTLFDESADDEFHFAVFSQGNNDPGGSLQSVSLSQIPEPSSLALIGLGLT
ncbi:MAG: PEP-CTERM sorting domain-containing protein, partial [Verrucomicrobiota bacterium JB023]|nr:PEP-CTERM sorting domain-containing protein [Verrucomicrobiota bacterium JB023]